MQQGCVPVVEHLWLVGQAAVPDLTHGCCTPPLRFAGAPCSGPSACWLWRGLPACLPTHTRRPHPSVRALKPQAPPRPATPLRPFARFPCLSARLFAAGWPQTFPARVTGSTSSRRRSFAFIKPHCPQFPSSVSRIPMSPVLPVLQRAAPPAMRSTQKSKKPAALGPPKKILPLSARPSCSLTPVPPPNERIKCPCPTLSLASAHSSLFLCPGLPPTSGRARCVRFVCATCNSVSTEQVIVVVKVTYAGHCFPYQVRLHPMETIYRKRDVAQRWCDAVL